jgi:hypothetical protein
MTVLAKWACPCSVAGVLEDGFVDLAQCNPDKKSGGVHSSSRWCLTGVGLVRCTNRSNKSWKSLCCSCLGEHESKRWSLSAGVFEGRGAMIGIDVLDNWDAGTDRQGHGHVSHTLAVPPPQTGLDVVDAQLQVLCARAHGLPQIVPQGRRRSACSGSRSHPRLVLRETTCLCSEYDLGPTYDPE